MTEVQSLVQSEGPDVLVGSGGGAPRVLLVEPDAAICSMLQPGLAREGFDVVRVSTAAHAMRELTSPGALLPAAVLCDIALEGSDGFVLCAQLRGDPRTSGVPFLLLSRKRDEEHLAKAAGAGADDYLSEPLLVADVVARIKLECGQRSPDGAFGARTDRLALGELTRALLAGMRAGRVTLKEGRASFAFRRGRVIDARFEGMEGEPALCRMLTLSTGEYAVTFSQGLPRGAISVGAERFASHILPKVRRGQQLLDRGVSPGARLVVSFPALAAALDQLPADVNRLIRLFDGRRTIKQVVLDCALDETATLEVIQRLHAMGILQPAEDEPSGDLTPRRLTIPFFEPAATAPEAAPPTRLGRSAALSPAWYDRFEEQLFSDGSKGELASSGPQRQGHGAFPSGAPEQGAAPEAAGPTLATKLAAASAPMPTSIETALFVARAMKSSPAPEEASTTPRAPVAVALPPPVVPLPGVEPAIPVVVETLSTVTSAFEDSADLSASLSVDAPVEVPQPPPAVASASAEAPAAETAEPVASEAPAAVGEPEPIETAEPASAEAPSPVAELAAPEAPAPAELAAPEAVAKAEPPGEPEAASSPAAPDSEAEAPEQAAQPEAPAQTELEPRPADEAPAAAAPGPVAEPSAPQDARQSVDGLFEQFSRQGQGEDFSDDPLMEELAAAAGIRSGKTTRRVLLGVVALGVVGSLVLFFVNHSRHKPAESAASTARSSQAKEVPASRGTTLAPSHPSTPSEPDKVATDKAALDKAAADKIAADKAAADKAAADKAVADKAAADKAAAEKAAADKAAADKAVADKAAADKAAADKVAAEKAAAEKAAADKVLPHKVAADKATARKAAANESSPEERGPSLEDGVKLYDAGRPSEAARVLAKVVAVRPLSTPAWVMLGMARFDAGDSKGAEEAARKVLSLDPKNGRAMMLMASIYLTRQQQQQAEVQLKNYLALEPNGQFAGEARSLLSRLEAKKAKEGSAKEGSDVRP